MIRGILFDKDGTLFDFAKSWSTWAQSTLLEFAEGREDLARLYGEAIGFDWDRVTFAPDSPAIAGTLEELAEILSAISDQDRLQTTRFLGAAAAKAEMVPAAPLVLLLATLGARDLALGVATNDAEAPARAHLDAHGVTGMFDFIAGYDSGYGAKPAPGMCLGFADAMRLDPGLVAMVGDSTHDLHAGRAAGMVCVGVLTGTAVAEDLLPHADAVLPDISALPAWLDAGRPPGLWGAKPA